MAPQRLKQLAAHEVGHYRLMANHFAHREGQCIGLPTTVKLNSKGED